MSNLQVLDHEAVGLEPNGDAPVHKDPYEAAKRVRVLVKDLREKVTNIKQYLKHGNDEGTLHHASNGLQRIEEIRNDWSAVIAHTERIKHAGKSRKSSEVERAVDELTSLLQNHNTKLYHARASIRFVRTSLNEAPGIPDQGTINAMVKAMNEIHVLAQSLPTVPNAPLNPAENQLRAIATLLSMGGYLTRDPATGMWYAGKEAADATHSDSQQ